MIVILFTPTPYSHIRSRHGYFSGLVNLPSGNLSGLFALGEDMDATNVTTVATRSQDQGKTWRLEGSITDRSPDHHFDSIYLKPTTLSDGTIIATGYRFHRTDPDELISNPQTDGLRYGSAGALGSLGIFRFSNGSRPP